MMTSDISKNPSVKYLKDYQPTSFAITHAQLNVILCEEDCNIHSKLTMHPRKEGAQELVLDGVDLELLAVKIDGNLLTSEQYEVTDQFLKIPGKYSKEFTLSIHTRTKPHLNTALEGLYKSNGIFCTQCEAEGFRKITYFYDRPDCMATFKVRVEGDKALYPTLLANGNLIGKGDLPGGRHWTEWEDPFPKPCYLFALVAGKFTCLDRKYTTNSGKNVALSIYTQDPDVKKSEFAMESLVHSMKWDEKVYSLECDLDHFKIVAVNDFNMGAMENKGLNIFNASLILANPQTSTDQTYQAIEAVVAHEYFHNWTGNRVTLRDWFQLCLKEGLTVFRDQEFSKDMGSREVCRIEEVQALKESQFPEDESPMSHPPRPDRFIEINNFYTTTVYEKGAEVVRMIHTLLGNETFQKGMQIYFKKFDGMAVTQEDYIACMEEASGRSLKQFMAWYTQAGTPHIEFKDEYEPGSKTYSLTLRQKVASTKEFPTKVPLHIPILMGLLTATGEELSFQVDGKNSPASKTHLLEMQSEEQKFIFKNIPSKPFPSLFRKFSAPVKLVTPIAENDLLVQMAHDSDSFNSWDASQKLFTNAILSLTKSKEEGQEGKVSSKLLESFHLVLKDKKRDAALKANMLQLPSYSILMQQLQQVPVESLVWAKKYFGEVLANQFQEDFLRLYEELSDKGPYKFTSQAIGARSLKNLGLGYLQKLQSPAVWELLVKQLESSNNMTDEAYALALVSQWDHSDRKKKLEGFYTKWQSDPLVINRWFGVQATSPLEKTLDEVRQLCTHPVFTYTNPNRLRSLITSFCRNNFPIFHHKSGDGYRFCIENILHCDKINPQMAAHLARAFGQMRRFDSGRRTMVYKELEQLASKKLSQDVYEIISSTLKWLAPS